MNSEEYANLERVEADHWYYSGKRIIVQEWIKRVRPPQPGEILLDCGAGTGRFAKEMESLCQVLVLDDHEEALQILRTRFRSEQIIKLSGDKVPLPESSLTYITALDVLEHVPNDSAVVQGFHHLLKPGGLAVVTVPASMALWSDWDEALHHFRRYSRPQLRALFPDSQWEIVHVNYTNVVPYPAIWLLRKWRRLFPHGQRQRAEDRLPPAWLNRFLRKIFVSTARWRFPLPDGVSLLLVARRRPDEIAA